MLISLQTTSSMITIITEYSRQFYYVRERMASPPGKIGAYLGVKPFKFSFVL